MPNPPNPRRSRSCSIPGARTRCGFGAGQGSHRTPAIGRRSRLLSFPSFSPPFTLLSSRSFLQPGAVLTLFSLSPSIFVPFLLSFRLKPPPVRPPREPICLGTPRSIPTLPPPEGPVARLAASLSARKPNDPSLCRYLRVDSTRLSRTNTDSLRLVAPDSFNSWFGGLSESTFQQNPIVE